MKKTTEVLFKIANTPQEFQEGASLFRQYAASLQLDLSFQDFESELKAIDRQYNAPKGALLLAYLEQRPIACVGIRALDRETAELKRMFVQEGYRGLKIGQRLLEQILSVARQLQYKRVRLDTLPTMSRAQSLYRAFGFTEIPSYRFNPVVGAVFMEKDL